MDIQESLHRILQDRNNVADQFYRLFFERYPEVRRHFEGVNLAHQAELLRMALMVMEAHYAHAYPATQNYLQCLGSKHHGRGVPRELYPKFRDALLATLEQFHGRDWDEGLAGQWREAF